MDPRTLVVLSDSAATADPCSSFNYVGDIGQPVLATHQITKLKPIFEKIEVSTAQMYPKVRGTARDDGVIGKSRYKSDLTSVLKRRSMCKIYVHIMRYARVMPLRARNQKPYRA